MKRKDSVQRKGHEAFDREYNIKYPGKVKKKTKQNFYQKSDDLDAVEQELLQLKRQESLEDFFDD